MLNMYSLPLRVVQPSMFSLRNIFRKILLYILVDASQAGEGQLEISINEGQVPNHVQVVGGGRCLISFTPEHPKPHFINIKFNGETVLGECVVNVCSKTEDKVTLQNLIFFPLRRMSICVFCFGQ